MAVSKPIDVTSIVHTNEMDVYSKFFTECIKVTTKENRLVRMECLYKLFKKWHDNTYPTMPTPQKKELIANLINAKYTLDSQQCFVNGIEIILQKRT
jgi:hypothetical protein